MWRSVLLANSFAQTVWVMLVPVIDRLVFSTERTSSLTSVVEGLVPEFC